MLGAIAGVMLAPHLVGQIDSPRARLGAALFLILALVVVGQIAGVVLGGALRSALRFVGMRTIDSIIGVGLQLVVVLLAAWLLVSPLAASENTTFAAAVRGSQVLTEVENRAPSWLHTVPKRISALWSTSGMPDVVQTFGRTPIQAIDAPDASLVNSAAVAGARPSVVKIRGIAQSCQKMLEGTGFVIAPNRVMSNAHVVAGSDSVTVEAENKSYEATVVSYDPNADISILVVPGLPQRPLIFADEPAQAGTDAIVLGYPGGGEFAASPARVREIIKLNGPDIYRTTTVNREVYTIRGNVQQGNSGGPMINRAGLVLGVVFGAAVDDADTGFVLTDTEISRQLARIDNTEPVSTGQCIS